MTTPTEELAKKHGALVALEDGPRLVLSGDMLFRPVQLQAFRSAVEAEFSVSTSQWQQLVKSNQQLLALKVKREEQLQRRVKELEDALQIAVRQNSHDMLMTGEEIRLCEKALANTQGENK